MTQATFDTAIEENEGVINGPFRFPVQMLAEQEYGGHLSIHDDDHAQNQPPGTTGRDRTRRAGRV